jgi:hypothetical protein
MEVDGIIEGNPFGEYRVKVTEATETAELDFKQALKKPGVPLGDTTIIKLEDVQGGAAA